MSVYSFGLDGGTWTGMADLQLDHMVLWYPEARFVKLSLARR
jgi:hypothetical protein